MKLENKIILIIVISIAIYASFLFISDYNSISENLTQFKTEYSIPILLLVASSWIPLILKWDFLLKKNGIRIPIKKNILIWLSGSALSITPGQLGELIKSQLLKNIFNIPRSKTAPIVFVDKFYDLAGAFIASIIGVYPHLSIGSKSTLCKIKKSIISSLPAAAAKCKGVLPS